MKYVTGSNMSLLHSDYSASKAMKLVYHIIEVVVRRHFATCFDQLLM